MREEFVISHVKITMVNEGKHGAWWSMRPAIGDDGKKPCLFSGSVNPGMADEIKQWFLAVEMIEAGLDE